MNKKHKNNVFIENDIVYKKRNDKIIELYKYLDSVGFDNHVKIVDYDNEYIKSEYINSIYKEENEIDFIKTVALLHSKTLKNKTVSKNKYRTVYDKISNNIIYLENYYKNIITNIENEVYMSPSHYLLIRNYSVIDSSLKYASKTLKKWFNLVKDKTKERVCIVHNNLSLKHFIKGDKNYLISFDNYLVDTLVLDLYIFYKKEGFKLDFNSLLDEYNSILELNEEEKLLLYVLIAMCPKIEFTQDEYMDTINVRNTIEYILAGVKIVK